MNLNLLSRFYSFRLHTNLRYLFKVDTYYAGFFIYKLKFLRVSCPRWKPIYNGNCRIIIWIPTTISNLSPGDSVVSWKQRKTLIKSKIRTAGWTVNSKEQVRYNFLPHLSKHLSYSNKLHSAIYTLFIFSGHWRIFWKYPNYRIV